MKMKNITMLAFTYLVLNFTNTACGWAPIFNHQDPNRVVASPHLLVAQTPGESGVNVEGCDFYFATQNLCATLNWLAVPTQDAEGSFRLSFWNKDQGSAQAPVFYNPDAASIFVKLWMPGMGHGSSPVAVSQSTDPSGTMLDGQFTATRVYFVMGGKWDIIVQLKDAKGNITDTSKMNYQANQ